MKGRKSVRLIGKFSGFFLINASALLHKAEIMFKNRKILTEKIKSWIEKAEKEKNISMEHWVRKVDQYRIRRDKYGELTPPMQYNLKEILKINQRREKERNLETLKRYYWNDRFN